MALRKLKDVDLTHRQMVPVTDECGGALPELTAYGIAHQMSLLLLEKIKYNPILCVEFFDIDRKLWYLATEFIAIHNREPLADVRQRYCPQRV